MEDNQTVDDIEARLADVSLTDPNVDLSAPTSTSDSTAADKGTNEAAANQDDQSTATDKTTQSESDAKTTEAQSSESKDESQANEDSTNTDKTADDQSQTQETAEDKRQAAQLAWQQRQRNRDQIAQQLDQHYGPKTQDELVAEGIDQTQAGLEALRQEMAYKEERSRISELNAGMRTEAVEVTKAFPVFDKDAKDYDEAFAKDVEQAYKIASRLQTVQVTDPATGQPTEIITNADVPLYDFYQRMATIYNRGTSRGETQRQSDVQDMLARTENPGGSSSVNGPPAGSLEEMEARLGDVVIT